MPLFLKIQLIVDKKSPTCKHAGLFLEYN